jgi:hypothetical protein
VVASITLSPNAVLHIKTTAPAGNSSLPTPQPSRLTLPQLPTAHSTHAVGHPTPHYLNIFTNSPAMTDAADKTSLVALTTSDNMPIKVERKVAERSILIKNLLEDLGGETTEAIPIPNVRIRSPRQRLRTQLTACRSTRLS